MAKLTDQEKQEIINREKPGFVVGRTSERDKAKPAAAPDAVTPDVDDLRRAARHKTSEQSAESGSARDSGGSQLAELRRKFLASEGGNVPNKDKPEGADEAAAEDEIVPVRRADESNPYDGASQQAKGVVISGKERRIIGEQG
jgi:hypothetical protein